MNLIKNKGAGRIISPEFDIPQIFSIRNGIIFTYVLFEKHSFTGILSYEFAINNQGLEPGTSIDLTIILPKTMVYYKNFGFNFKYIFEGNIVSKVDYHLKSNLFIFPFKDDKFDYEYQRTSNNFFWEINATGFWRIKNTFKLGVGGILC